MRQSSVIFFYMFAAFLIFITMRGELPVYMGFLLVPPKQKTGSVQGANNIGALIADNPEILAAL